MNIGEELKGKAVSLGLCEDWTKDWKNSHSPQELIDKYISGLDFCIEHDFPSVEYIRKNFTKGLLEENNLFVDSEFDIENSQKICVINGNSNGKISFSGLSTCDLYVRHESSVEISASGLSKIFVSVYDKAKVNIKQSGYAKVYVYLHSDDCEIKKEGDIMIRK